MAIVYRRRQSLCSRWWKWDPHDGLSVCLAMVDHPPRGQKRSGPSRSAGMESCPEALYSFLEQPCSSSALLFVCLSLRLLPFWDHFSQRRERRGRSRRLRFGKQLAVSTSASAAPLSSYPPRAAQGAHPADPFPIDRSWPPSAGWPSRLVSPCLVLPACVSIFGAGIRRRRRK